MEIFYIHYGKKGTNVTLAAVAKCGMNGRNMVRMDGIRYEWIFLVIVSILLIVLVFGGILAYTPYYNDTVIEYSDKAPRVGNNIYGYMNVPEGYLYHI